MGRAIVLALCLTTAAGVAAFTHYFSREPLEQIAVFTVPQRVEGAPVPAARPRNSEFSSDKVGLARHLQRELMRVGCYSGEINGVWTTSSRMAMKAFVDRVNSTLPIDTPDPILLSLVRGQRGEVCEMSCAAGQSMSGGAACVAKAATDKTYEPAIREGTVSPAGASAPLAAGAAAAAAAMTMTPKDSEQKSSLTGEWNRPATHPRDGATAPDVSRDAPRNEAAGPAGSERRQRRSWKDPAKPPRVVRDFLRGIERTFGLK